MGQITTTLPEQAHDKVDERHEETGLAKSEIVRNAVMEYFDI